jgi:hypothetical protein
LRNINLLKQIEQLIKLLKPKYYNRITYLLIISAIPLLTKPLWLELVNWGIESSNENYKKINIPIIEEWDWLLGLVIILIALIYNTFNRWIELKTDKKSEPQYKKIEKVKFSDFIQVCKSIYPILLDNEYIFKTVGPNSGANATDELRTDLTLWYKYRSESILPNNQKIKEILEANQNLFSREIKTITDKMILHIDAFEEHTKNPQFDYSNFQFPLDFKEMIETKCFENAKTSKKLQNQIKWLNKKLKPLNIVEWYLHGSTILIPESANDVDIVILINSVNTNENKKINSIKMDFKLKFQLSLHTTIFTSNEQEEFRSFLERNVYKIKGNG